MREVNTIDGTDTGLKWQCVEYARRWLLIKRGAVFDDVEIAADIWNKIDHLTQVSDQTVIPLIGHLNGSDQLPGVGDLLVYANALYGTGHVAVIISVDPKENLIKVGEQNFNNRHWPASHARQIDYIKKDDGYWILDPFIIGWKHAVE
ncbi:MAG: CHAP domain-containing protein [Pseudomonadota bacterium]